VPGVCAIQTTANSSFGLAHELVPRESPTEPIIRTTQETSSRQANPLPADVIGSASNSVGAGPAQCADRHGPSATSRNIRKANLGLASGSQVYAGRSRGISCDEKYETEHSNASRNENFHLTSDVHELRFLEDCPV
jgi:hypothetical protein